VTETAPPKRYYTSDQASRYDVPRDHIAQTQKNLWQERNRWRLATLCLCGAVVMLALVIAALGRQPAETPVFIKVNHEGQLQIAEWDAYHPAPQEIERDLLQWMRCVRGIPNDRGVLERCWQMVPRFLLERTQAWQTVAEYFAQVAPDKALWQKHVDLKELRALQEPDGRWRVTFTEEIYDLPQGGGLGRLLETRQVTAIAIVIRRKPTKKAQIAVEGEVVNPRGLYITHLAWSS
jgi:type IV secretory pathway TrbF-like protein